MPDNQKEKKALPPYIPFETFRAFIESLKSTAVPPIVDTSILPKMSGSMRSQLISSLKFLGLVDGAGKVSPKLKDLVSAYQADGWKQAVGDLICERYSDIVGDLDLENGTSAQLDTAFRLKGNVDGQVLEKCVRFYLAGMKEAELKVSPFFTARKSGRRGPRKNRKTAEPSGGNSEDESLSESPPIKGTARFRLPIPGKTDGVVLLPDSIDKDDWEMLKAQLDAYVGRLIKQRESS